MNKIDILIVLLLKFLFFWFACMVYTAKIKYGCLLYERQYTCKLIRETRVFAVFNYVKHFLYRLRLHLGCLCGLWCTDSAHCALCRRATHTKRTTLYLCQPHHQSMDTLRKTCIVVGQCRQSHRPGILFSFGTVTHL
jgi:hypothetical protein